MQGCRYVIVGSDVGGHSQVCASNTQENEEERQDSKSSTRFLIVLCNATSRSCESVCLSHDVGEFVEHWETIEVETFGHQQSTLTRKRSRDLFTSDFPQRIVRSMAKTKLTDWSRSCTEITTLPTSGNLIMWTWFVESWETSGETTQCIIVPQSKSRCEKEVHHDDFVCFSDADGLKHMDFQIWKHSERFRNTWIRRFRREKLSVLNGVFGVGVDQTGQHLDIEPDLIHAPLIISESECNSNTETKSTPLEKLQDKLCGGRNNGQMTHQDTDLLVWDFQFGSKIVWVLLK